MARLVCCVGRSGYPVDPASDSASTRLATKYGTWPFTMLAQQVFPLTLAVIAILCPLAAYTSQLLLVTPFATGSHLTRHAGIIQEFYVHTAGHGSIGVPVSGLAQSPVPLPHGQGTSSGRLLSSRSSPTVLTYQVMAHRLGAWLGARKPSDLAVNFVSNPRLNWGPTIPLPTCPISLGPFTTGFDICQLTSQALLAVYGFVTETIAVYFSQGLVLPLVDPADRNSNFLLGTPPAFTFLNPGIQLLYFDVSVPIALSVIALIVAWGGIGMIVRPHLGLSYQSIMEFFPRLLLGIGLALFGLTNIVSTIQPSGWLSGLIEFTNALDQAIPNPVITVNVNDWPDLVGHPTAAGIVFAGFAAGSTILLLAILGQLLMRVAVIDLLIVTAPLAMICWVLPQTQRWTELWTRTFVGMLLVQPIQLLALNVGAYVAISTLFNPLNPTPVSLILQTALQVAILVVVYRLPRLLQQNQAFAGSILSLSSLYYASRATAMASRPVVSSVASAVGA